METLLLKALDGLLQHGPIGLCFVALAALFYLMITRFSAEMKADRAQRVEEAAKDRAQRAEETAAILGRLDHHGKRLDQLEETVEEIREGQRRPAYAHTPGEHTK